MGSALSGFRADNLDNLAFVKISRRALLLGTACCAIAQYNSLAKSLALASPFAGCYELRVPAWSATEACKNDLLPTRFQLTMLLDPAPGGKEFVARNQDSKVHYAMLLPS
jgi:hypothetical protein